MKVTVVSEDQAPRVFNYARVYATSIDVLTIVSPTDGSEEVNVDEVMDITLTKDED